MIAVVNAEPQSRLKIGTAAAAGMARELMDDDLAPGPNEPYPRRKSGKTGTYDMHYCAAHHTTPYRRTAQRN